MDLAMIPQTIGARLRPARHLALVALSGAATGFFSWSLGVDRIVLNSFVFQNNLPSEERVRLLLFLVAGALLFVLLWALRTVLLPREEARRESIPVVNLLALAMLLGFVPFLRIRAFEVYYPLQIFCLVIGMLAALLMISSRLFPPAASRSGIDGQRWGLPAVLILCVGYAIFFGLYTVLKHAAFHSYALDLGWQNQVFYTLLDTGNPRVTGTPTINALSNHFQPLYYLLAPIYALRQDAATLLLLQAVLLPAGAIPLFLVARRRLGSPGVALTVAIVYLLYPALHGLNTYDFHGIVLLIPILCFLLYFLETGRKTLYWLFFALALITREDAPITLLGVGLYQWLILKKSRMGLVSLAVCIGYFLMTLRVMAALGGYANLENYWDLGLPEHQSFTGVVLTLLTNPFFVTRYVFFNTEKLVYLLQIFTPVLFLPFFSGKKLILLAPGLAIILLSANSAEYSIGFQYSAHIIASVFYLSICGIAEIRKRWPRISTTAVAVPLLVAGLAMNYEFGLVLSKRFPGFLRPDEREKIAYSFFPMIPPEASVATISRLYPHLSGRTEIYPLEQLREGTDYVLADLYPPAPASDRYEAGYRGHTLTPGEVKRIVVKLLDSSDYGVLRYEQGFLLLKRGHPITLNQEVSGKILALNPEQEAEIIPYFRDPATEVMPLRASESDRLVSFLESHAADTILIASSGNVIPKFSYLAGKYLLLRGSSINTLRRGGSYVAVVQRNAVVFERIDNRAAAAVSTSTSEDLRKLLPGVQVSLRSSGGRLPASREAGVPGAGSSIEINGVEFSLNRPGLNAVVLDYSLNVREQASFDTTGG